MKYNIKSIYHELVKLICELQSEKKRTQNKDKHLLMKDNYRILFENATISIWDEDFTLVFEQLDELRKLDIPNIKIYLKQNPEVLFSLLSKLKVNSVNKATLKLFKAESSQDFLNNVKSTFGKDANKVFVNLIESIWNNKKSFTSEVNYKTLKGDEFPALFSVYIPQTELELKSVPVSIQSIQALRDAESAKRESLIKLEQAQKMAQIGSWEWNSKTDEAVWSDEMYRIYGVEKDDFDPTSKNVGKTIVEEDKHKMERAIGQLMQGELVDSFEFKIIRPNNEIRVLKIIGLQNNEGNIFGVTQDITDRKKIETKLNEAQALAKVGSWLYNPSTQKIEWSDETFHLWGFDSKDGAPEFESMISRIHPDDQEFFINTVDKALNLGIPYDIEHRMCLPNGEQKTIRAICQPILGLNSEVVSLTGTSQDITSHKLLEQAQVKHQRLKAIGEMSASIAHDFNNSLQEMIGNLEIVKLQNNFSDNTLERLNNIGSIIDDVADRVTALQKFGDQEHNDKNSKLLNFNTLIEDVLKQSRPLWKDAMEKEGMKITVITDFEDISKISCNSGELKSAIYNLVKNSIEAMPEGGDLIIKTGMKTEGVYATFTDTGIGMDEETKLKVFEPFYSTKGFESGRGLGMSGVYSIVKKHNGDVMVKSSELTKGTTIEVIFPICKQNEIEVISENKPKDKELFSVLWVDDDFLIAEDSSMMVESIGHKCNIVYSGKDALEYLNNNACDIVFTDIGMPLMNGKDLAKAIRNKFGNKIKIVAVTGWNINEKVKDENGIDFVMQKPFTLEELKKTLLVI